MKFTSDISKILDQFELNDSEKENLVSLFDFTNYLYDDDDNLTKIFNLRKHAREKLIEKIKEMFELEIQEHQELENITEEDLE